jgi:hypothetical protein
VFAVVGLAVGISGYGTTFTLAEVAIAPIMYGVVMYALISAFWFLLRPVRSAVDV